MKFLLLSQNTFEFTVPMALEDYLPIIFSAVGLFLIAKILTKKQSIIGIQAWIGAILIVFDGFLKATWKLIYASTGNDIAWMHDSLFLFMGPGFFIFAFALWRGLSNKIFTASQVWLIPLVTVFLSLSVSGYLAITQPNRSWARVLLALTTIGTVWVSVQLIRDCLKKKLYLPIFLFIYNVSTIFAQAWLAQLPQTTALHWIGQINNTFSWAAFAIGVWIWQREPKITNDYSS
jgi:hypothetical protein